MTEGDLSDEKKYEGFLEKKEHLWGGIFLGGANFIIDMIILNIFIV